MRGRFGGFFSLFDAIFGVRFSEFDRVVLCCLWKFWDLVLFLELLDLRRFRVGEEGNNNHSQDCEFQVSFVPLFGFYIDRKAEVGEAIFVFVAPGESGMSCE